MPVAYAYYAIGVIVFAAAVFFIFGLDDVHNIEPLPEIIIHEEVEDEKLLKEPLEQQDEQAESKQEKCTRLMKNFFSHICEEKCIIVSMISGMSLSMTFISSAQFATIIFNESYQKDQASKDYISDRLTIYLLIG